MKTNIPGVTLVDHYEPVAGEMRVAGGGTQAHATRRVSDHPDLLEPPRELNQQERLGWRSFFAGRALRSMQGGEESAGWWKARGHVYALGWASVIEGSSAPEAIRGSGTPHAAWVDGRQHHQRLDAQAHIVLSALT
jgi:hypothetical protein